MSTHGTVIRGAIVPALLLVVSSSACMDAPPLPAAAGRVTIDGIAIDKNENALGADVRQDLAALRQVTARFHDADAAAAAGWSAQITPCMSDPEGSGAMGFHYGKPSLIDGNVRADSPELLLYEPETNGRLRLVAVEYIVPLTAWRSPQPPRLFGRDFKVNEQFQVWALHAWVWKENPSGMFADWNPMISCTAA